MPYWQSREICNLLVCPVCGTNFSIAPSLYPHKQKRVALNMGCGLIRFVICAFYLAPRAVVVGIDLPRGVAFMYRVVRHKDER